MNSTILTIMALVGVSAFDALRDTLRGQIDYWPYHAIKWAAFYPPLIWIWIRDVHGWKWKAVAVVLAWVAWKVAANLTRPEHWGPASWGWSVFTF